MSALDTPSDPFEAVREIVDEALTHFGRLSFTALDADNARLSTSHAHTYGALVAVTRLASEALLNLPQHRSQRDMLQNRVFERLMDAVTVGNDALRRAEGRLDMPTIPEGVTLLADVRARRTAGAPL